MKVTRIEAPLDKPWRIATFDLKSLLATIVRLHSDEGPTGLGASGPICIAASLHFAAATPGLLTFENMYIYNPLHEMLAEALPQPKRG